MRKIPPLLLLSFFPWQLMAQTTQDPEFPKEFIMHLKLHNGMVTKFTNGPDLYIGGIQLVPQYTVVEKLIRAGIILDGYYTSKKLSAAFGPTITFKLKTLNTAPFGSAGNINISFDHLWGTNKEQLLGGSINADIGNKLLLGLSIHRDYNLNTWWLQNTLGLRISKLQKTTEIYNK
jgi:hypothetical protein